MSQGFDRTCATLMSQVENYPRRKSLISTAEFISIPELV